MSRQIQQTVRVSPLIIIPCHNFKKLRIQFRTGRCINDRTVWGSIVILTDEFFVRHTEYTGHGGLRGESECTEDFLEGGWFRGADCEVDHGYIGANSVHQFLSHGYCKGAVNLVKTYVGTRMDTPVTLPLRSGRTAATALAAPVDVGIMLLKTPRPMDMIVRI